MVLAGKEYGTGSSRDWAAKGTKLLGVRAVIAQSFERIHRSNLVGMGVLPLQFKPGDSVASLGLTGEEMFSIEGIAERPARADRCAPTRQASSRRACGSTRPARPTTTATAASSSTSCEDCSPRERQDFPQVLRDLLAARGPSGYETARPRRCGARRREAFGAEVGIDVVGTPSARVPARGRASTPLSSPPLGRPPPRRLVVMGHIDEIGLIVTHIDDEGFLWFREVGGWDPQILVGQRVVLGTREGELAGVIGKKPIHLLREEERKKVAEVRDLHIDIGARDGEQARELVRVGDVAVIAGEPVELPNGRIASRALDNRLGSFVALEAARLVAQAVRRGQGRQGRRRVGARRRGRRAGGDHLRGLAHQGLLAGARRGDRGRRDPRHRRPRDRGEGVRQAPARLGARAEPGLDAAPPPVRAAARHRRAREASPSRWRRSAATRAPTPMRSISAAAGFPPRWCRSRSATCTPRWSWWSSPTCTPPHG